RGVPFGQSLLDAHEYRFTKSFENDLFRHQGFGKISSTNGVFNQRPIPFHWRQQGTGTQVAWGQPGNVRLKDNRMIGLLPGLVSEKPAHTRVRREQSRWRDTPRLEEIAEDGRSAPAGQDE